jgi:hypothetical protein
MSGIDAVLPVLVLRLGFSEATLVQNFFWWFTISLAFHKLKVCQPQLLHPSPIQQIKLRQQTNTVSSRQQRGDSSMFGNV